jgi:hypothetical protein
MQPYIVPLLHFANSWLIPLMLGAFVVGAGFKFCLYFLKRSQLSFVKHVEKKIYMYLIERERTLPQIESRKKNFQAVTSELLNVSYFEHYELKAEKMRRKLDYVTTVTDRAFLLLEGAKRLTQDLSVQLRYHTKDDTLPDFDDITAYVSTANPAYNRLFGIFSNRSLSSFIALLPGLFVIGGIFGTFVGIMLGLPELSNMDLASPELTKKTMDQFLVNVSYSMNTSLVGIALCVCMNVLNTFLDGDELEEEFVHKLKSCLILTWKESHLARLGVPDVETETLEIPELDNVA